MKSRFLLLLTVVNLVLFVFQIAQLRMVSAQDVTPVLRGRALEIVDAEGRVRASVGVHPPTTVDSQLYPETVVFRLTDPKTGNVVKLDASSEGAGLGLSDGSEQGRVRLMAKSRTGNFVQVTNRNGREQLIKP
jgi:hypothetical protein